MRRVLIISPNFAPLNTPDMQRVRMSLPHFRENGWDPVVLALEPESSGTGVPDPLLEATFPSDIRVERVRGIPAAVGRKLGVGSIWWRCGRALRKRAEQLLAREHFDLVFFSTTVFETFALGPRWLRRYRVPYVLDYQDPWINPYYERTNTRPPGGWLKFGLTQWRARRREPEAVREAAGVISVSDSYVRDLTQRYQADPARFLVLPFGASPLDFKVAAGHRPSAPLIDFADGNFHIVYAGRSGPDMGYALTVLFRAFRRFLETHPVEAGILRFHFIGGDYAPPPRGRQWVRPIAEQEGVAPFVQDHCHRVSYFDALHYLGNANALVVLGSSDATYSASKLFPYVLARRPMLLVFHENSLVLKFAQEVGVGTRIAFSKPDIDPLAEQVYCSWFVDGGLRTYHGVDDAAFAPYTAASLTRQLAGFFDRCLAAPFAS